jgi:hypothetical protein
MIEMLTDVLPQLVMASSSSDSDGGALALLAAGPAAGAGLYWMLYRYYRNTDKSHSFEQETLVEAAPIQGHDQKVDEIRGTRDRHTKGHNESNHRQRCQRVP